MNPQGADLLSQLRDIHAAPAVPWWPPAPGWWVLAALAAIALFFLCRRGWRRYLQHRRRRRMLRFVDAVEAGIDPAALPQDFLSAINRIFKAVALSAFPDARCAHLQGEEWAGFLRDKLASGPETAHLDALAVGPYQPRPVFDPVALARLARDWIMRYG